MMIGKQLKLLRCSKNLTLQNVSDDMHMSISNISMIEHNKRALTLRIAIKFANFYGMKLSRILRVMGE